METIKLNAGPVLPGLAPPPEALDRADPRDDEGFPGGKKLRRRARRPHGRRYEGLRRGRQRPNL